MEPLESLPRGGGFLYEAVAEKVSRLVEAGTFRPGQRIPSVRGLGRQLGVSLSTVLEAYALLEDRGIVEARPQSGYYVRGRPLRRPPEPEISAPAMRPTGVSVAELVMMVLRDAGNPDLLQLGAAIPSPDLLPIDKLNRALGAAARRHRIASVSYEMPPGSRALRVQVARRALEAGCAVSPEEVVITSGCQEAITLALRALCEPGDTVAVESPTYYNFLQAAEVLGLKVLEIPTHPRDGLSIEALSFALDHSPVRACVAMPNFNNPLGALMPDERKCELVALLARRGIPLIEDDIHGELSHSGERPRAAKAFDREGLVVLCSSVSKTLAPGYRVGWTLAGRFQKRIEHLKAVSNLATPTLPQLAVAEFLANGGYDRHLRRVRRVYARRMASMADAVARHFPPGTRLTRPAGAFALWVELPPGTDALVLYEKALAAGITVAPGPIFSPTQRYRNFLRLNAGYWIEGMEGAVETLGRLARECVEGRAAV
ncbi:MAG: PLP-dependent aminotransferase family protein [Thermodesulfobacteriota bacterium]